MKTYQRKFLRAPYRESILFRDGDFVFNAKTLNISEGGLLIYKLPHFPNHEEVPLMIGIPQLPYFKNFTTYRLKTFSQELFPKKIIRLYGKTVRREEVTTQVDDVFKANIGLSFSRVPHKSEEVIKSYVETYTNNLIYLQMLIDSFNTDEEIKIKTRTLAKILGYSEEMKISQLRFEVGKDYKSLQW